MTTQDLYFWVSGAGVLLSWVVASVTATWRVAAIESRAGKAMDAALDKQREQFDARMTAQRERTDTQFEAKDALASKARHDLIAQFDRSIIELRGNLRDTDARHAVLDREAIRKADLAAFEARLSSALAAHEGRITAALSALDSRREADMEKLERRFGEAAERLYGKN